MCTVHSFQGWESRHIVLLIGPNFRRTDDGDESFDFMRTVYVGLSRVTRSINASRVVVVNAEPNLDAFFERNFVRDTRPIHN